MERKKHGGARILDEWVTPPVTGVTLDDWQGLSTRHALVLRSRGQDARGIWRNLEVWTACNTANWCCHKKWWSTHHLKAQMKSSNTVLSTWLQHAGTVRLWGNCLLKKKTPVAEAWRLWFNFKFYKSLDFLPARNFFISVWSYLFWGQRMIKTLKNDRYCSYCWEIAPENS